MPNTQIILIIFSILILNTLAAQLKHPFKQCSPRSAGEILSVTVNAPCNDGSCTFYKGTDARLDFTFRLRKKTQTIRAKVLATIGTMDHEFNLLKQDVCKQLGCPLKAGTIYSYHHGMLVDLKYPTVRVNQLRYYLIDGKGREVACVSVPVIIADKDSKP